MMVRRDRCVQPAAPALPHLRQAHPGPSTLTLLPNLGLLTGSAVALSLLLQSTLNIHPSWIALTLGTAALSRIQPHVCFRLLQIHRWPDLVSRAGSVLILLVRHAWKEGSCSRLMWPAQHLCKQVLLTLFCQATVRSGHDRGAHASLSAVSAESYMGWQLPHSYLATEFAQHTADPSQRPGPGPFLPVGILCSLEVLTELLFFPIREAALVLTWGEPGLTRQTPNGPGGEMSQPQ